MEAVMKRKRSIKLPNAFVAYKGDEIPNKITLSAIDAAEHDEDMTGPFDSVEDMFAELNHALA